MIDLGDQAGPLRSPSAGAARHQPAALAVVRIGVVDGDAGIRVGQQQRNSDDAWTQQQKREMLKKQNEHRQEDLKKDTDKLLELATELKQYVDKTNENIISLDVIRKAEQIEKLAKSVKDKMKGP